MTERPFSYVETFRAMKTISARSVILLLLCLGACGSEGGDDTTGLSPGEMSALNEAAAELDARPQAPQDNGLNATASDTAAADQDGTAP